MHPVQPGAPTDYDSALAQLDAQRTAILAAKERDQTNQRDPNAFTLAFHPSDTTVELSAKLNALAEYLGVHPMVPAIAPWQQPDPTRAQPDAEQTYAARSSATGSEPLAQPITAERVRVQTGQPAPPPQPAAFVTGMSAGPSAATDAQYGEDRSAAQRNADAQSLRHDASSGVYPGPPLSPQPPAP